MARSCMRCVKSRMCVCVSIYRCPRRRSFVPFSATYRGVLAFEETLVNQMHELQQNSEKPGHVMSVVEECWERILDYVDSAVSP